MHSIHNYLNSRLIDSVPLLELALKKDHSWLIANNDYTLIAQEKRTLDHLIKQRQRGIPFAYLSGTKGFYHLDTKKQIGRIKCQSQLIRVGHRE
jgi:release factor glutamine methyltransferase